MKKSEKLFAILRPLAVIISSSVLVWYAHTHRWTVVDQFIRTMWSTIGPWWSWILCPVIICLTGLSALIVIILFPRLRPKVKMRNPDWKYIGLAVVVIPIGEEVVYRLLAYFGAAIALGLMGGLGSAVFQHPWYLFAAMTIAASAFAFEHYYQGPVGIIRWLLMGVLQSYFAVHYGIWVAIAAHAVNNALGMAICKYEFARKRRHLRRHAPGTFVNTSDV